MNSRGFTLLELLVAMAIFAVVGVMAFGGLIAVLNQQELAEAQADRWREVHSGMRVLTRDLQQLHPRPVRDALGDRHEAAVRALPGDGYALQLTRGGWTNPSGLPRATLQRVAYRIEDDRLVREYWPVLDRTLQTEPVVVDLFDGVDSLELRLLDWRGQWQTQWPPPDVPPEAALHLAPRAVELTFELQDMGRITRLLETGL